MSGLTDAERREMERIEDSGDTQGLTWRVEQIIAARLAEVTAERDRLRDRLAAVEALADEQATFPGQCCPGLCLTGLHDLDADTLTAFREVIRTELEGTK